MSTTTRPTAPAPKAYSYLRFSTPEQLKGDSLRRQLEATRAYAAVEGLDLDEELTFRDLGVSAFSGRNATAGALGAFRRAVEDGVVEPGSYLLVESLDRVSRANPRKALRVLEDIVDNGVAVVTMTDRKVYTKETIDEATGLLGALLVFMRANEESTTKPKRVSASWEQKRRTAKTSGTRMTATGPAWLRASGAGFEAIPDRAAIVRRVFEETAAGDGQHKIAERLTREGVPTWKRGAVWHRTYVRKMLDNPAVIGTLLPHVIERREGGGHTRRPLPAESVQNYYPAVVSQDLWLATRAALSRAPRGRHAGKAVRHLLAGLARCPRCGSTMTRVYKGVGEGIPKLVCVRAKAGGACAYHSVNAQAVDGALFDNAAAVVSMAPAADERGVALREQLAGVAVEEDEIELELAEISAAARGRLTPVLRQRRAELYARLEVLRAVRERVEAQILEATPRAITARLDRMRAALAAGASTDLSEANRALREALKSVTVDYRTAELVLVWAHTGVSVVSFDPAAVFAGGAAA
jgi:DNA invertase Pin-like site-specific DNA recombinase